MRSLFAAADLARLAQMLMVEGDKMRGLRVPIVIGLLFAVLWIAGTGANAQPYPPPTPTVIASLSPSPSVPPPTNPPSTPPTVFPSRGPEPTPPSNIPFTGADLTRFVLIGAALTGLGAVFVKIARRPLGDN